MKRDFNLIRKLLIKVEQSCDPQDGDALKIEGYDEEIIQHHLFLLLRANLISGITIETLDYDIPRLLQVNLTWDGHDFLDSIRDEQVWETVNKKLKVLGGTASLEIIKQIAIQVARQLLGFN